MLIGTGVTGDKALLLVGLSKENLRLLQQDRPIDRDLAPLGVPTRLLIVYGETEAALAARLKAAGVLAGEPQVNESLTDSLARPAKIDPELRATLLWHFGTTDPRVLHESINKDGKTFEEMLARQKSVEAERN